MQAQKLGMRIIVHINKDKIKHFILVFIIASTFNACATLDKYLALFLQSGMISAKQKDNSLSNTDIASTSKKADSQTNALMNEMYKGVLSEVKECQSINDKFNKCATAEYNNGKIYKILVYSQREVGIAIRTLAEFSNSDLNTGLVYCVVFDEECDKISFKDGVEHRKHFKGDEALRVIREYFEMDISFESCDIVKTLYSANKTTTQTYTTK